MTRTSRVLAFLAAACFTGSAFAGARDALDSFTSDLEGLDGRFSQQVYDGRGQVKERSSGRVALSAPRLFRWEYVEPYPQLIVADGRRVWVYDPDLEQVTVQPQSTEEQNSPLAVLIEPGRLDRDYRVEEAGSADGLEWLDVAPKGDAETGFQSARLGFDGNVLARMEVVDALGQRTAIAFSGWKKNPEFAAGTFSYDPPEGVDVVGDI
ncbi:outer membrane lipoprotein chaperone LolA [Luteimonas sp. RD2P54]|uniref:Outer-membrane lipoprotein carrier protein n=1 Tax=Luteimonas endophytica TaxID=3042023 RepID=A0ABT6J7B6_9GAMM|nr:outer membrane lipoprotein chaperone LolA [Luteimonas endophytica]MDH5822722.1 outer membrane lipoprotein chaperone LolA [Luteimonas endophytica]